MLNLPISILILCVLAYIAKHFTNDRKTTKHYAHAGRRVTDGHWLSRRAGYYLDKIRKK